MSEQPTEEEAVYDINVEVTAVLGGATLLVNQLLKLGRGAVQFVREALRHRGLGDAVG